MKVINLSSKQESIIDELQAVIEKCKASGIVLGCDMNKNSETFSEIFAFSQKSDFSNCGLHTISGKVVKGKINKCDD